MTRTWDWFNGKKTVMGTACLFASAFITQVLIDIWGLDAEPLQHTRETLDWLGLILGGTGLMHKAVKGS